MTYLNVNARNDTVEALKGFATFLFLITVLIIGAVGVLIVLFYMEYANPSFCIFALGVYCMIAVATLSIAVRDQG